MTHETLHATGLVTSTTQAMIWAMRRLQQKTKEPTC